MVDDSIWQIATAVVAVVGCAGTAGAFLFARGRNDANVAAQAKNAEQLAITATANCNLLLNRLHDDELHNATMFTRLEAISQNASAATIAAESRLSKAIDELKDTMRDLIQRFDTALIQIRITDRESRQNDRSHGSAR